MAAASLEQFVSALDLPSASAIDQVVPRSVLIEGDQGRKVVSIGLPWVSADCSRRWIGDRVLVFSAPPPDRLRISLVSSRLKEHLDQESWWFDLLRTSVLQCHPPSAILVTVEGTAPASAVSRAAALFGRHTLNFRIASGSPITTLADLRKWLCSCAAELPPEAVDGTAAFALVSPEVNLSAQEDNRTPVESGPVRDRLLLLAANRIQVLSCRSGGSVSEHLRRHLRDEERCPVPLLIATDRAGRLPPAVSSLPSGWTPWLFHAVDAAANDPEDTVPERHEPSLSSTSQPATTRLSARVRRPLASLHDGPLQCPDAWLLHWTRAVSGPWAGQTWDDFLDSLILQTSEADHSAAATLCRIIGEQKIRASSEGIRGGFEVVSFTAVPLTQFRARRIFRKHRRRFDFEPWGIGVRRAYMEMCGIRPVHYGSDSDWEQLGESDRPWFQKHSESDATQNSAELEWRVRGDVSLADMPPETACIFVGSTQHVSVMSELCHWPVILTPGNCIPDSIRGRQDQR